MFDLATRNKYRFESSRGELTTEDLWEVPLQRADGFDLDNIARNIANQIKLVGQESFVATKENPVKKQLENKLEVVKAVISFKIDQKQAAVHKAERAEKRRFLLDALANKKNEEISQKSVDELEKELAALDD
jgi:hypothetical protein